MEKLIPLRIKGINNNIYAGFWSRLSSLILDTIFVLPFVFLMYYLNTLGKNLYYFTGIIGLIFGIWYNVYLPKKYGGTPGKILTGIKILKLNGDNIHWKEAFIRETVNIFLHIFQSVIIVINLQKIDEAALANLKWYKHEDYLLSLSPAFFIIYSVAINIWIWGELLVLLTNRRKRAIHDFMAGTVIVKAIYVDKIRETMNADENLVDNTKSNEKG